ncbi:MAG: PAS domain S-box protein [Gemmatimonadota bacterium]
MKTDVGAGRQVAAASAIGLGFLCAAALLIAYSMIRSRDALVWVDRTHTVINQIWGLEAHLSAAEAAQRTFLLTADSGALATYRTEQAAAAVAFQNLQDSIRDPLQRERFRQLGPLLRDQASFREQVIQTAQARDSEAAAALLRLPDVTARRAAIQGHLREATSREIALLAVRHRERASAAMLLNIALGASLAVAALLGAWVILLLRGEVSRSTRSERRERELIEQASDGIFIAGPDGRLTDVNDAGCRMLGRLPEEIVGRGLAEFLAPEDADRFGRMQAGLLEGQTDLGEWWLRRKNGVPLPVELSSKILPDGRWQGIARDVTDRHRAQEALAASEARYRRIVETASEGIWIVDRDGRTSFVNERMALMLGYTVDEMLGRIESDFLGEPGQRITGVQAATAPGTDTKAETHDVRLIRRDGSDCWTMVSTTPIRAADGSSAGALCMVTDVTERRQLEEDLRQAQKMDAMGRMAAAVAHDFNNLLTVIRSAVGLLREAGPGSATFAADLDEIDSATNRAASLTAHLLAFCRRQPSQPGFVRVGPLLREFGAILPRLVPPPVRIELAIDEPDLGVWSDPIQLEQVLINLAVNARDAMPAGGTLRLGCGLSSFPSAVPHRHGTIPAGDHVAFTIADTGSGMSAEVLSHLFEPFYTTKGHGEGTGLGLATVYGIVRQAGGTVVVESHPGRGSTFTVYLPRAQEPGALPATRPPGAADEREPREDGAPRATNAPTAQRETVLVVDDEDGVRHVAGRVLERLGYRVLTAASGLEALDIMLRERARIRALVTDVRMPGMTGLELVELLRTGGMDLPVLFMSGYTDPVALPNEEAAMPRRFLAKPFGIEAFTAEVGALLKAA